MAEFTCFGNKVALITGAGGILGGGCAVQLAKYGASLAFIDNNKDKLDAMVTKVTGAGLPSNKVVAVHGDVTVKEDVQKVVDSCVEAFGKLDIVINIVGHKRLGNLETCDIDDLDVALNGCVRASFMVCKAAIPHLIETKGCVVNMSSVSGIRAYHYGLPYGTAKAALNHMTKIMASGMAKKGVRINAVAPSLTKPDDPSIITEDMQKWYDIGSRAVPYGRVAELHEVVKTILYLASDSAGFITGAILPIDGAYTQTLYEPPPVENK